MMGETKKASTVTSAAPSAGAGRIVAGTIGEAAAIARRAATGESDSLPRQAAVPDSHADERQIPAPVETEAPPEAAPDPLLTRRTRAGAGHLKDTGKDSGQGGDQATAAAHLILADRAYAYGRHIVAKDKATKLGDLLAIDS